MKILLIVTLYDRTYEDRIIARDESNKNVYVSSDMTYKQYKEKFILKKS